MFVSGEGLAIFHHYFRYKSVWSTVWNNTFRSIQVVFSWFHILPHFEIFTLPIPPLPLSRCHFIMGDNQTAVDRTVSTLPDNSKRYLVSSVVLYEKSISRTLSKLLLSSLLSKNYYLLKSVTITK